MFRPRPFALVSLANPFLLSRPSFFAALLSLTVSPQFLCRFSLSYSLASFFWLPFCLAPASLQLFSLLQSRPILLASFLSRPSFFAALPSLTVSPHSFGFLFVSPQFLCRSSLSYSLAPFFWLPFCLAPVSLRLFSLLQSRPSLFAAFLSVTVSPHSFGFLFVSPQFLCGSSLSYSLAPVYLPLFSLLQSRPILLASFLFHPSFFAALLTLTILPQFICRSFLSYNIALFFWIPFCLAPVSLPLFSLLQYCPVLLDSFLSRPSFFCPPSLPYNLASLFWFNICLASIPFLLTPRLTL